MVEEFRAFATRTLPSSSSHAASYRADIDGLRAIAILAVVLFHADLRVFASGFVGVDIFFVISGFLVGGHVFQEVSNDRFSYASFYVRRAKRILPALLAMVVIVSSAAIAILSPDELEAYAKSTFTALIGTSNVWFWHVANYFAPDAKLDPMLMTWSLGIEEQYYVFLPFLFLAFARFFRQRIPSALAAISALSFVAYLIVSARAPAAAFYLLPFRLWELGIGTLIAIYSSRVEPSPAANETLGWGGAVAMLMAATTLKGIFAVSLAVIGVSAALIARRSKFNQRLLSAPPMIALGVISYSWYLWHWPLMAFARLVSVNQASVGVLVLAGALSLPIAYLSWRYIEQPFRRSVKGESHQSILIAYATALGGSAGVALLLVGCAGIPQRIGTDAAIVEKETKEPKLNPCLAGPGDVPLNQTNACVTGSSARLALIGDSHASMLAEAFRPIAERHGYGLAVYTKATCPAILGLTHHFPRWPLHAKQCADYNRNAIAAVLNDKAVRIVVLSAMWSAPLQSADSADRYHLVSKDGTVGAAVDAVGFERQLRRTIDLFTSSGRKVIVLGDVPNWKFDPLQQFYAQRLPARRWAQSILNPGFHEYAGTVPAAWVAKDPFYERAAARGVVYLPLKNAFCDANRCRFMVQGKILFFDNQHVTREGALVALNRFRAQLSDDLSLWR